MDIWRDRYRNTYVRKRFLWWRMVLLLLLLLLAILKITTTRYRVAVVVIDVVIVSIQCLMHRGARVHLLRMGRVIVIAMIAIIVIIVMVSRMESCFWIMDAGSI